MVRFIFFNKRVTNRELFLETHRNDASYLSCLKEERAALEQKKKEILIELNLSDVHYDPQKIEFYTDWEFHIRGNDMFSVRQIHCFLHCKSLIQDGKNALAYHELYDFIEDYGRKKGIALSLYELQAIRYLLDQMEVNKSV
ncbi:hypothetical protein HGO21_16850 [Acinetobacter sp. CUI P1]|nr:hypothetical protein [Acinetobacter sp. CUI P1]